MPLPHCVNNRADNNKKGSGLFSAWARLLACGAALAIVWLLVLPAVAERPAMRRYIERNERLGIDPSAKFYTELPGMPDFFDHTDTARRRHAAAFRP